MKRPGVPRQMPMVAQSGYGQDAKGVESIRRQDSYTMTQPLKSPFPWPGGKSDIAPVVWRHFGQPDNYVEPFAGSSAMLLGRPGGVSGTETVNDLDGLLINALRAITLAPDETAAWCDWPVSEADLTARHLWLKAQRDELTARLFGDWRRAVKDSITVNHGLTALFLDPPYPSAEHGMAYHGENHDIWHQVASWVVERGDDPRLRIALSGYFSEEADRLFPESWTRHKWEARGGYSNQAKAGRGRTNAKRECVWFSPQCIDPANDYAGTLFEEIL